MNSVKKIILILSALIVLTMQCSMIRILTKLGRNGRNVIKVVAPIIHHVLDFGFHVKENRHTTSLITSAIRQWINNVQVECNVFISRMSYLDALPYN